MELEDKQFEAAEDAWSSYDVGEATVIESGNFETDGPNRLICRFYHEDDNNPDGDSLVASFCVNFVPDTDKVEEAYINW
jgi:hypothetical protein